MKVFKALPVFLWLVLPACSNGNKGPRLIVPLEPVQMGEGVPGEELRTTIDLENVGNAPLQIEKLEAGCSCAWISLEPEDGIPPNGKAKLSVGARMKPDGKDLIFAVRVYSNDPNSPEAVLTCKATAGSPVLRTEPAEVRFEEVAVGTSSVKRASLLKPDGRAWPASEPVKIEVERGIVDASVVASKSPKGEDSLDLEVRFRPRVSLGQFEDFLVLKPTSTTREVRVPVVGNVVPLILVSPNTLVFAFGDRHLGLLTRKVLLRRTDGVSLARIEKTEGPFEIQVQEAKNKEASKMIQAVVTLDPAKVKDDLKDGKLLIWLEGETKPLTIGLMILRSRNSTQAAN